ncbi:MAG: nucleotide exchange factor GrpE [Bacteroidales bacterium]|nr:nucleotide exchange factor GrpE [Bacteroidales bacterium]MCL2132876.1 nucleotide exchange factor GrpE [Bacteroidales bacterium]
MKEKHKEEKKKDNQRINDENQSVDESLDTAATVSDNETVTSEPSMEEKMTALEDKYLRLVAEFDNYRKRTVRERIEFLALANEELLAGILPVLDDMERAAQAMQRTDDIAAMREGVLLIQDKLIKYLENRGLKMFDATGKELNTDEHEAVTKIPAPSDEQKGKVVDVIQHGYTLNGKVIRYAKVVVGE